MNAGITTDELISAWREALATQNDADEGLTSRELAKVLNMSRLTVKEFLRILYDEDKLIVGRKTITSIDGRRLKVPVYRLK